MKADGILSNGHGNCIKLRDSIGGDEVLVMIATASARAWVWVKKDELKAFIDNYLEDVKITEGTMLKIPNC